MAVDEYISTFTSSILMVLGWNLGSAKSARNLPRSVTSPSHSVFTNLSPIMLATAAESRITCAWFHNRSSATSLAASAEEDALEVCAAALSIVSRQQAATLMMELPLRSHTFASIFSRFEDRLRHGSVDPGYSPIENTVGRLRMSRRGVTDLQVCRSCSPPSRRLTRSRIWIRRDRVIRQ